MTGIVSPEEFYGFKPGTDRKLIRWERVVDYFYHLDGSSDMIKVVEEGKSTEGHPILLSYISSPKNLKNLDKIRDDCWSISHPNDLDEEEVERIIVEGKTVVVMTMSIHASEVGGTQGASDLAFRLITSEEPLIKR
ncbi:MAG: peptidase M14 family protein, partial [Deltaproteobacteria bacterium]|nr:peptidase M14 family protein [Deltaproteobacteria bacterium]